ncbi:Uncharacterised protein [Mycobacteroides abscessus subsp. abscessus]|nr:Uncharacterised protein [Mycobacteroides abscessus subsp. abscessus]SHX00856.1 Uncharacterised protein [Mycobacteroides abscessus subsp. abscessus]SHX49531.1 Uncharacterised protein [Mycobacteroides abscessus subsp. abscessus]SHZ46008.1 Uncharacterised protein [Mycobacteroides abscessus subsp. abscessus]SHZ49205.1 Uncharacterised protein [Mycobacteroides abscessus subsp. abscessus]
MITKTMFHGGGVRYQAGERVRRLNNGYAHVATSERWADAFAFRDAASRVITDVMTRVAAVELVGPAPIALDSSVCRVTGFVHTVEVPGPTRPDPEFETCAQSRRTSRSAIVVSATEGTVSGWREFTSIVGPYQKRDGHTPAFDADGYLLPAPLWKSWGYTREGLRLLGPWFPFLSVLEDTLERSLVLVSEFSIPFLSWPQSPLRDRVLDRLGARMPFTLETAEFARTHWWQ